MVDSLHQVMLDTVEILRRHHAYIAVAESCTGGLVCKVLTDPAGSSAWFDCGFITYGNAAKVELLGLPPALITEHGAVSQAVVEAMACSALERSRASVALAISGIAGPEGGSRSKPVGTIWLGWANNTGTVDSACRQFEGDREHIREQAAIAALLGAQSHIPPSQT